MYQLDATTALELITNLTARDATRFTLAKNDGGQDYYLTIVPYPGSTPGPSPDYIVSYSPAAPYSLSLFESIQFFSVCVNPYASEILVSQILSKVRLSYSITKTLVYMYLNSSPIQVQFRGPYVNDITAMKQAILNLYGFPTVIFLINNLLVLQFNWIDEAFEMTLNGVYENGQFHLSNFFDFNKTLVVSESDRVLVYWNNSIFRTGNYIQQLTFSAGVKAGVDFSLVIGFNSNYLIKSNPGLAADDVMIVRNLTNNTNEIGGSNMYYFSLAGVVPLDTAFPTEARFYLTGVAGLNYRTADGYAPWAVLQALDLFNIDNAYTTISARIEYQETKDGLQQYLQTSFWYALDAREVTDDLVLRVYQPSQCSDAAFNTFLVDNQGTIMTSDLILMTRSQIEKMKHQANESVGTAQGEGQPRVDGDPSPRTLLRAPRTLMRAPASRAVYPGSNNRSQSIVMPTRQEEKPWTPVRHGSTKGMKI